jgi:solute carrier family 25, member 33/36
MYNVNSSSISSSSSNATGIGINNTSTSASMLLRRTAPLNSIVHHIRGTLSVLNSIYVKEGMGALWKGVGATVVGVMPSRAIYFSTYAKTKHVLVDRNGGKEGALIHLAAAAAAGIATATATNPIWLIKTRMQLQESHARVYSSSWDCLRRVIATEGVRGLYKGLSASYLGVAEGTIQWVLYERLKTHLKSKEITNPSTEWLNYFFAAAGSKLFAATLTYPHEVLRTRLREQSTTANKSHPIKYRGLLQAARLIVKEEGAVALYGGMTAHMMRVVPNSAIMFFCYEFLTHIYHKQQEKKLLLSQ